MIHFPCRCGYVFEAPADLAGGELQCPECHLLNNVPRVGELQSMEPDGIYKIDAPGPVGNPSSNLRDLLKAHAPGKVDGDGSSIDRRNTAADMENVGDYEVREQAFRRERPRYDPETGELVRPIPIVGGNEEGRPPANPSQIPFAKAAVSYASKEISWTPTGAGALLALMQPTNLITMGFVLVLHLMTWGILVLVNRGLLFIAPLAVGMILVIFAHYGNTIDEIATEDRDELPRLLRDLRFREDIWWPTFSVIATLTFCYAPALWLAIASLPEPALAICLSIGTAALGTFIAPALLLTLLTSGSLANVRPDRVISVVRQSGKQYIVVALLFVAAMAPYLFSLAVFVLLLNKSVQALPSNIPDWLSSWMLLFPLLCAAMFLMHYFCWRLAWIYREHHFSFPWVGRYHTRERTPLERRKRAYVKATETGENVKNEI